MSRLGGLSGVALCVVSAAVAAGQGREGFDLNDRGLEAAGRGQQAEAERLYREAIEVWRKMGPEYAAHRATVEYNLGQSLCAQGRRREAIEVLEDALEVYRGTLGMSHINTLTIVNYLAATRFMLGDTGRAAVLYQEALPVERELYPKDVQLARTLGGLSSILVREGKTADAVPPAEESLTIALAAEGEDSLDAALAYANAARAHQWAGHAERALPLYRKSLSIYERLVGPGHPRVASILTEVGLIEMQEGKDSLAERDLLHAMNLLAKGPPVWMFEQWVAENNLGLLRLKQGKLDEAGRLLTHSLALQEQAGVRAGLDRAATLKALAQVRDKQRRYEDAKQLREQAVTISSYR